MALGDTGITTSAVETELGLTVTNTFTNLVGYSGLNRYSRYSPLACTVDGSKNILNTAITTSMKLGDFRRYDHSAVAPTWWDIGTQYHTPGTTTWDTVLMIAMESLNLQCFATNGIDTSTSPAHYHVRVDVYDHPDTGTYNRATGTPLQTIYPIPIDMVAHTPLTGHSRQATWVMNTGYSGNQIKCTTAISAPMNCGSGDLTRYCDVYFCDTTGANRIINFGTSRSAGYFDVVFHEQTTPYLQGGANTGTDPGDGGWTGFTYPRINTSTATPFKCSYVTSINLTFGDNAYSFWLGLQGVHTTEQMCAATADVRMTRYDPIYGSEAKVISSGVSLLNTGKIQISGTLSGWTKGNTWFYDETATITIENITYGAYSAC